MGNNFLQKIVAAADLQDELIPGQTLVEIAGNCRVLIEHHYGVTEYGRQQIQVKVKYGTVHICGQRLELARMTKDQLVICGLIESVRLERSIGK
jgi:sporulation protein YqfC